MILNPVYVKKGGGTSVNTIALIPAKGVLPKDEFIQYQGRILSTADFPAAYNGGLVTFLNDFSGIKIEGNVLTLVY